MPDGDKEGVEKKGGFHIIKGAKVDLSGVNPNKLNEIAAETGAEFPIEADSATGKPVTKPEFIVVVPDTTKKKDDS